MTDPAGMPIAEFEGEVVRQMEGKLPALTLDMAEGYPRHHHIVMEVEVRVRNVNHVEDKRGDLVRQHNLAIESARIVETFSPDSRPSSLGGNLSSGWQHELLAWLDEEIDELDFEGEEIPARLRDMLKRYFDSDARLDPLGAPEPFVDVAQPAVDVDDSSDPVGF